MAVRKWIAFWALLLLPMAAWAQAEEWLGIFLQGRHVGYVRYAQYPDGDGFRDESLTVFRSRMLNDTLQLRFESTAWTNRQSQPLRMRHVMDSSGRRQIVEARVNGRELIVEVDNSGSKSRRNLSIPADKTFVSDATSMVLFGAGPKPGDRKTVLVFDPTTVSLIENTLHFDGPARVKVGDREVDAQRLRVVDPRATTTLYLSSKGDLIKMEGPLGMEMRPMPREQAMAADDAGDIPDLATASTLRPNRPIERSEATRRLRMDVRGVDLRRLPSDTHQRVTKVGDAWRIDVRPVLPDRRRASTIAAAARMKPEWTKPSLHIPSDSPRMRKLAREIAGDRTNVVDVALRIRDHVYGIMRPNAGIGVLRNAEEILESREGVCRDYAMLTAALMRAAGLPTRLVNGLVHWDGQFYYHAWVEVWDGRDWIGFDSTRPQAGLSATHIKITQGNVEQAYVHFLLEGAQLNVLEVRYED